MKKKILTILKYIFFLSAGIGLLWYVFKGQDFNKIYEEFLNANYYWILLALGLTVIANISRAIRWNILINSLGYKTKISTTYHAITIGYLVNFALPRVGEITRCGILSKRDKIPINSLIGTMIVERAFDLLCLLIIILLIIFFQLDLLGSFSEKYLLHPLQQKITDNISGAIFILISSVIIILIAIILFRRFNEKINKITLYIKLKTLFLGFFSGIKSIKNVKKKGLFIFHTVIIWGMYSTMTFVGFFAISSTSGLNFLDGITIMAIGSVGIVAPVPGGIGAYEITVITALKELYGIAVSAAYSFAIILHGSQIIFYVIFGIISIILLFVSKNKTQHATS